MKGFLETINRLLHSRKFWALILSLLGILAAYLAGDVPLWTAIQTAVAALAAWSVGVAIEGAPQK